MRNRLFQKLFFTTVLGLMVSIFIMLILLGVSVNNYFVKERQTLLTESCTTIANVLSSETDNSTGFFISLNGVVEVVSKAVTGETYVSDSDGHILHCSCDEWKKQKSCIHSNGGISDEVLAEVSNSEFFEFGHLKGRFENIYYTAGRPIYNRDSKIVGFVFISQPASQLETVWTELSSIFVVCAIIPIVLLFIYLFAMTKKMTKPINLMSEAAVNMSKGDFSKRIPVSGNDEISDLAEAFNRMSNSLSQLEGMRRSFIANVSHELRTPMTTIGGFIDGILDGTIPPERREYYLELVSNEIRRLSRLVQSMLSLARLESGEHKVNMSEFQLCDLVCEVLFSQEQRIESKKIEISGLENGGDIKVNADRDLIYQAVYNLVDNAIKFTPEGGTIAFDIGADFDGRVHFKIKNPGKGINPEELQYVFDRFYKTDRSRSANKDGTGLGLYIVKTIIDIHKGNITVSSVPNEFTEFEIVFSAENKPTAIERK